MYRIQVKMGRQIRIMEVGPKLLQLLQKYYEVVFLLD